MIGNVKLVSYDKGYGFIVVRNQPRDIYFKVKDVSANRALRIGDQVEVEAYVSAPGKVTASKVVLVPTPMLAARDRDVQQRQRAHSTYYAKPTYVKDSVSRVDEAALGFALGSVLGPVGGIVGALIGATANKGPRLLTQSCLKCGGTGHVTTITPSHIGFQCKNCKNFWTSRNKDNVEEAKPETMSDKHRDR